MAGSDTEAEAGVEKPPINHGEESTLPELNNNHLFPSYVAASAAVPVPVPAPDPPEDVRNSPCSKHRGLFNHLVVVKPIEDPIAYSRELKWLITFLAAGAAAIDPISSTIFYRTHLMVNLVNLSLTVGCSGLPLLASDLHISPTIANLAVALSQRSPAICPLWWSFLSEKYGRRTVYIVSMTLYLVFNILSAKSISIGMLIVMRVLSSGTGCSVTAVGAGTVSDIWEVKERGRAMNIYYLGPLLGPALGPVIGGVLTQRWDWRATQWFLTIYGALFLVSILFCLPETLRQRNRVSDRDVTEQTNDEQDPLPSEATEKVRSQHRARRKTTAIAKAFFDPLRILTYLRFPAILITVYFASITFGIIGVWCISIQESFSSPPYNYSALIVGLLYLPFSLGLIVGSILGGKWSDHIMAREARSAGRYDEKGALVPRPEDRMRENAWLSIAFFPGALLWYGWATDKAVLWIVPMLATFFIGTGSILILHMVTTMLTEVVPHKSASLVALNALGRNLFSCVGGVIAQPLIGAIGTGWLFTVLALVATASSGVIWAMRRFGPRWREALEREFDVSD